MTTTTKEPFYQHVDQWFEDLIEFGKLDTALKTRIINLAAVQIPNRRRLADMIRLLEQLPGELKMLLVKQASAILCQKYKDSFRYTYNRISRLQGQCSATSEFFSMIGQAISYND